MSYGYYWDDHKKVGAAPSCQELCGTREFLVPDLRRVYIREAAEPLNLLSGVPQAGVEKRSEYLATAREQFSKVLTFSDRQIPTNP